MEPLRTQIVALNLVLRGIDDFSETSQNIGSIESHVTVTQNTTDITLILTDKQALIEGGHPRVDVVCGKLSVATAEALVNVVCGNSQLSAKLSQSETGHGRISHAVFGLVLQMTSLSEISVYISDIGEHEVLTIHVNVNCLLHKVIKGHAFTGGEGNKLPQIGLGLFYYCVHKSMPP